MDDETLGAATAARASEPIPVSGAILPHGAMLACDPVTLELRCYSRNFVGLTLYPGEMFPGLGAADLLGRQAIHDLHNALATSGGMSGARGPAGMVPGLRLPWSDAAFDVTMHRHAGAVLIELEPAPDPAPDRDGPARDRAALNLTRQLVGRLEAAKDGARLLELGARLTQAMLGFDRATVYRLMPDGGCKPVAEARLPGTDGPTGHHLPTGKIAPRAQALYLANPVRAIPDTACVPVPLIAAAQPDAPAVDMSHAQLRAPSPGHCEYLRGIGVGATLSISIVVEGALWGLIACHNRQPKAVPPALRIAAELFGHCFALQLDATERREAERRRGETRARLDRLMEGVPFENLPTIGIAERLPRIAELMGCAGAAFRRGGQWSATPLSLSPEDGARLLQAATGVGPGQIWQSARIAAEVDGLTAPGGIAGAMVIPLSDQDAFFLFRRSAAPGIAERHEAAPAPWSGDDLAIAEALRSWLRDAMLAEAEADAHAREEAGRRRSLVNEELNHRIRNVLSLVRSITLQTGAGAASVDEYSELLEGRLQALASAHDQSLEEGSGALGALIEAEAALHRSKSTPDRVVAEGPDLLLSDKTYGVLALALHELMTNAAKYGALSVPGGRLRVGWSFDESAGLVIDWRERGGPPVLPPRRTGFGSRLIRNSVEHDLGGRAEIDFDPEGLVARIAIPPQHVALAERPERDDRSNDTGRAAHPASLDGLSVLLVEDQSLIAMDTAETLRQLGAAEIRIAASGREALSILDEFRPDLSVLDFDLGDETAEAVAAALVSRRSPFIFVTGYSDRILPEGAFRNVPVIRKPVSAAAIAVNVAAARAATLA
ncbi:HWE histidine kinase domain-containing protein [Pseudogemmobacter sonorensis]|uniref:HWE histidine kinase domain-containing protein n=1 Tax=Pseudogemmobacter sonorensis TaxID=2989681 RepID=UPI0036BA4B80